MKQSYKIIRGWMGMISLEKNSKLMHKKEKLKTYNQSLEPTEEDLDVSDRSE